MFRATYRTLQTNPWRRAAVAIGAGCAATLAYNNTPPRRKLLADSRGVNPANFDNRPIDISNARRASQSGHVDDTGKQRAFVSNSERDNPAPPSQTRGHRGLPGANSAAPENEKDSTSEPILATIFERFALFDISGLTESLTKIIVPSWVLALPAALHKLQDEIAYCTPYFGLILASYSEMPLLPPGQLRRYFLSSLHEHVADSQSRLPNTCAVVWGPANTSRFEAIRGWFEDLRDSLNSPPAVHGITTVPCLDSGLSPYGLGLYFHRHPS